MSSIIYGLPQLEKDYYAAGNRRGTFQGFLGSHPNLQQALTGKRAPVNFYGHTFGVKNYQAPSAAQPTGRDVQPTSPTGNPSYDADPVLQQIRALGAMNVSQAEAAALSGKKEAAVRYGNPDIVRALGLDEGTVQAAAGNPFSTTATLNFANAQQVRGLNENLNRSNLFYGTERGRQLSLQDRLYQEQTARAGDEFRKTISDLDAALLAAKMESEWQNAQAEGGAAWRMAQFAPYGVGDTSEGTALAAPAPLPDLSQVPVPAGFDLAAWWRKQQKKNRYR